LKGAVKGCFCSADDFEFSPARIKQILASILTLQAVVLLPA
jgi:hypothetical protein